MWNIQLRNAQKMISQFEIDQHADDIEAAFRRILYHPDVAVLFAYVYSEYLIVPVGQVFGSRNAPSF